MLNTSQRELASINAKEPSKITNLGKKAAQEKKTDETRPSLQQNYQAFHNELLAKDLTITELQQQLTSLQQLLLKEKKAKEALWQQLGQHKHFITRLSQLKQLFVKQKQFITRLKQLFIQEKNANKALNQQLQEQKQLNSGLKKQLKEEKEVKVTLNQQLQEQKQLTFELEQQIKDLKRTATIGAIHLDKWRSRIYSNR